MRFINRNSFIVLETFGVTIVKHSLAHFTHTSQICLNIYCQSLGVSSPNYILYILSILYLNVLQYEIHNIYISKYSHI